MGTLNFLLGAGFFFAAVLAAQRDVTPLFYTYGAIGFLLFQAGYRLQDVAKLREQLDIVTESLARCRRDLDELRSSSASTFRSRLPL